MAEQIGRLVLTRTIGETLVLADGLVTITLAAISGKRCKLLIECPRSIGVHRGEVHEAIQAKGASNDTVSVHPNDPQV